MHFLNIVSIFLSLAVLYKSGSYIFSFHEELSCKEEIIAISAGILSILNICMDIALFNVVVPKILSHFCFGSVLFQSLLSLFMIGYLVQNKKQT